MNRFATFLLCFGFFFSACSSKNTHEIKIAATAIPQAEILERAKPLLKEQGIDLKIIVVSDFNTPNRLLAEGEIDANYFQHIPFLDQQIKQFHYPITCLVKVHLEPMGLYSHKIKTLSELKKGSKVALPNDPSNEGRALLLLHENGVIKLKNPQNLFSSVLDIIENPKNLKFIEVDAALLPRILEDVDAAVINTNFALQANLNPLKDALLLESSNSPYANIVAIEEKEKSDPKLLMLKEVLNSDTIRQFILEKYEGAVIPAFGACQ